MDDHYPPAEEVLTLSDPLRRDLHLRRGGALPMKPGVFDRAMGEVAPDDTADPGAPDAAAKLADKHSGHIEAVLSAAASDPALVAHARAYLDGADDPTGAAAIASIVDRAQHSDQTPRTFTDGWIASRGLAFAACALTELSDIASSAEDLRPLNFLRQIDPASLRRVRGLLALCPEEEYERAVERLAAHRGTRSRRLIASYLVPTRHDWAEECCADPPLTEWGSNAFYRERLWASVSTPRHLELLGWRLEESDFTPFTFGIRATMADGVGPAIAPVLVDAWDRIRIYKPWRERLVELISLLPSDEAFKLLLERYEREFARERLLAAMEHFPVRAARVLSAVAASDSTSALLAAALLPMHLKAHPELRGPDPAPRIPDAPGEDLPAVLTAPGRAPRLPAYADPDFLPQVLLKDGGRALPAAATRRLVALAKKPDERLDAVRDACDRRSLADLGWTLFLHGDAWALPALGQLGDGRTARDLAALIPGWVARGTRARAIKAVDAIARIGTEEALKTLEELAQTGPDHAVRDAAARALP
ncbi:HEAT repeat domain-containing protein [Nonomuraea longicatena]|uniref:HEAT repeat domain-containing protein n=1 Tax=Nonomuraea longicatena TaxID=83682 RepID=A0ABP4BLJ8_9ACTN